MSEKIIFNGRLYYSPNDMDPKTREIYEKLDAFLRDRNSDGVPDVLQEGGIESIKQTVKFMKALSSMGQVTMDSTQGPMGLIKYSDTSITVNGRKFRSVEEMPPEIRTLYQQSLKSVGEYDPAEVEIFDEPWRERDRDSYFIPHDDEDIQPQYRQPPSQSVMEPVTSNVGLVIAAVLAIIFIAIGAFVWISGGSFF